MSADILAFPARCEDTERKALIVQARADYDSIFPAETTTSKLSADRLRPGARERNRQRIRAINRRDDLAMDHTDNGVPSDSPYCAPDSDPA